MTPADLLARFQELCGVPDGSIQLDSVIEETPGWSSLTFLGLIAMADEVYEVTLRPQLIHKCHTIADLMTLIESLRVRSRSSAPRFH